LVVALIMLAAVLVLRVRLLFRRRREERFMQTWRPLLMQAIEGMPSSLPKMRAADRISFLRLWNHLQESVRGDATGNLNRLLVACGLENCVERLLESRSISSKLIGVATVGHLRQPGMEHKLRQLAG